MLVLLLVLLSLCATPLARVLGLAGAEQITTYGYDLLGNLRTVQRPAPAALISYGVDGLNRRLSKSVGGSVQRAWAYEAHEVIAAVYRELCRIGTDAQLALLPLLEDNDVGVRLWASSHALEFASSDGERVLSVLEKMPRSFVGLSAKITLLHGDKVSFALGEVARQGLEQFW